MILVYVTCGDMKQAKTIAKHLLRKKLIACANMYPIASMYWDQSKIVDTNEVVLLLKSNEAKYMQIKNEVASIHTYKIPCIIKIDADANLQYQQWITDSVPH